MLGLYGPIVFGTTFGGVATFDQLKKTMSARWGEHEIFQSKPMLEYAGPKLIDISFDMMLIKPVTIDPVLTIFALQEIMDLAIPNFLMIGRYPMGRDASLFIMEDLDTNPEYFFRNGQLMGAKVKVKLKEYPTNFISSLLSALGGAIFGGGTGMPADVPAASNPATLAPETAAVSGQYATGATGGLF